MTKMLMLATACGAALSAQAGATVQTYAIAGTFADGAILSGGFSFDDAVSSTFGQFSNVSITLTGVVSATVTSINNVRSQSGGGSNLSYAIGGDSGGVTIRVGFLGNYTAMPALTAITSNTLTPDNGFFSTIFSSSSRSAGLTSGTITRVSGAVPEPASWAMMAAGFGMIGYAFRKRKAVAHLA